MRSVLVTCLTLVDLNPPLFLVMLVPHASVFEYEVVTVDSQGVVIDRQKRRAECQTEALGKGVNLELVMIPSG